MNAVPIRGRWTRLGFALTAFAAAFACEAREENKPTPVPPPAPAVVSESNLADTMRRLYATVRIQSDGRK